MLSPQEGRNMFQRLSVAQEKDPYLYFEGEKTEPRKLDNG
jgi:hypothetical protein